MADSRPTQVTFDRSGNQRVRTSTHQPLTSAMTSYFQPITSRVEILCLSQTTYSETSRMCIDNMGECFLSMGIVSMQTSNIEFGPKKSETVEESWRNGKQYSSLCMKV